MKHLKHPVRAIREPFGTAGLIVAVVALIAALGGGAYAANAGSEGGKANASAAGKQGPRGPKGAKGAKGATGAPGSAGAQGPAGPLGAPGSQGSPGANGTNGKDGTSVTTSPASEAECGKAGGVKIVSASPPTKVCNGTTGFTKTLPPGETETGTWSIALPTTSIEFTVPISFPIPLAKAGAEAKAFFFTTAQVANEEFGTTGCKWEQGNVDAKPEATTPGTLCVFDEIGELNVGSGPLFLTPGESEVGGFGPAGSYMFFSGKGEPITASGTWAVTAPTS